MGVEMKCRLLIDSCCDLPHTAVAEGGAELIGMECIDGESHFVDDLYETLDAHEFFQRIRDGHMPSTAQPSPLDLRSRFERAARDGVPLVYLTLSSGLSGTYQTACLLRDQVLADYPAAELYVVDSLLASIAEGLLAFEAMRQCAKGLSASELVSWLEEARWFVNEGFLVDSWDCLARGGRIPATVALAGSKLDVKPLLGFDLQGHLVMTGFARGRKKAMRALVDHFEKHAITDAVGQTVIVAGADVPKEVGNLRDMLAKVDEHALYLPTSIGPVIGSHVGPGMLALAFWGDDRREDLSIADRIAQKIKDGK